MILAFLKIGALSFGGGLAMIPFFKGEIALHNWVPAADYDKLIAVAQVVPGPFAIDSSAYIGLKVGGLAGAVIASLALSLPSFIAMLVITRFYVQFKSNKYIQAALVGVRPAIIGLLISAAYIIGLQNLLNSTGGFFSSTALIAVILIILGFLLLKYTKINPIIFILMFGVVGIIIF